MTKPCRMGRNSVSLFVCLSSLGPQSLLRGLEGPLRGLESPLRGLESLLRPGGTNGQTKEFLPTQRASSPTGAAAQKRKEDFAGFQRKFQMLLTGKTQLQSLRVSALVGCVCAADMQLHLQHVSLLWLRLCCTHAAAFAECVRTLIASVL